jgi:hypothetical protein
VQVDEAGGDDEAVRVDHLARLRWIDAADGRDEPVADADVAAESRGAAAVDDHAVPDHAVVAWHAGTFASGGRVVNPTRHRGARVGLH